MSKSRDQITVNNVTLLYPLDSTRAVIGQFSGPYSPVKFKVDSVAKLFCDLSPTVLNFNLWQVRM